MSLGLKLPIRMSRSKVTWTPVTSVFSARFCAVGLLRDRVAVGVQGGGADDARAGDDDRQRGRVVGRLERRAVDRTGRRILVERELTRLPIGVLIHLVAGGDQRARRGGRADPVADARADRVAVGPYPLERVEGHQERLHADRRWRRSPAG